MRMARPGMAKGDDERTAQIGPLYRRGATMILMMTVMGRMLSIGMLLPPVMMELWLPVVVMSSIGTGCGGCARMR